MAGKTSFKRSTKRINTKFRADNGRFVASADLRTSPASRLNQKAYRNANIANTNGRFGIDTTIRTNGGKLYFSCQTLGDADAVLAWLQSFESNWGNSKL